MKPDVIFWIFVTIFTVTAVITLLGITNVIQNIKEKYLTTLFTSLILEVVAGVIALFTGFDYSEVKRIPNEFYQVCKVDSTGNLNQDVAKILPILEKGKRYDQDIETLQVQIDSCKLKVDQFENDFYTKIIELDRLRYEYRKSINLNHKIQHKDRVFQLLHEIFSCLDRLGPNENTNERIRTEWVKFKTAHQRGGQNAHIILRQDIPLLVSEYLEKNYELKFTILSEK